MTATETEELVAAVTEPTRRQLVDLLLREGESTPSALALELPVTRQAVSKHLTVLDRVGLVSSRRQGRETHYQVNFARLDEATASLISLANGWERRLLKLKRLAEATHAASQQRAD
jgi:ArsR family transcriptional regulator, cadmium/lead-responsive transcriptional repressor